MKNIVFLFVLLSIFFVGTQQFVYAQDAPSLGGTENGGISTSTEAAAINPSPPSTGYAACANVSFGLGGLCNLFLEIFYWFISLPVFISGLFLYFAGFLFDNAIAFTILNFSQNYTTFFAQGVDLAWASFRDVGNIIMIGVFVYISFRVMLGMESFGMKSFAARLVIVALLINFSLFFTKIIIDVSNITATQFVRATGTTVGSQTAPGAGIVQTNVPNIAQVFASRAGVTGWWEGGALNTIKEIGKDSTTPNGATLRYVILTTIFFLAVGSVLLHGAILMITRMVALVLLMVTSSFAWVSFMTPKLEKFWDQWWDKMIKYALFAPLYMLLLWSVLKITESMGNGALTGAIKSELSSTAQVASGTLFTSIMHMTIVVGLLYGATKIADSLSIAGAKQAKSISLKGFSLGARLAGAGAVLGAGEWAANKSLRGFAKTAQNVNDRLARTPVLNNLSSARLDAQLKKLQEKQISLADTKFAKASGLSFGKAAEDKEKDAFGARLAVDNAKKDLQAEIDKQRKDTTIRDENAGQGTEKAPETPTTGGAGPTAADKKANKEFGKEQAKQIVEATRKENATRAEDIKTLRAQLSGAQASGDKASITNIERKIKGKQEAIQQSTEKISGLAEKLQAAEEAELRAQAARGSLAADTIVSGNQLNTNANSSQKDSKEKYPSDIKGALDQLNKTEEYRRKIDLKALAAKGEREKQLGEAARELAGNRMLAQMAKTKEGSERNKEFGRLLKEIQKGGKSDTDVAFDTLKKAMETQAKETKNLNAATEANTEAQAKKSDAK